MARENGSNSPVPFSHGIVPVEVFDLICSYIDCPTALLSCSLTCKRLSNITSEHLQYCKIRADVLRHQLWKHLVANPRYAARIRDLDIYEELDFAPGPIIPPCARDEEVLRFDDDDDDPEDVESAAKELILAVRCMPNLERFSCRLSRIIPEVFEAVSEHCFDLHTLGFVDPGWRLDDSVPKYTHFLSRFKDLRSFSYTNPLGWRPFRHPETRNWQLQSFRELLHDRCPNLEELHLVYETRLYSLDLPGIFNGALWPKLKRLSVTAAVLWEDWERFFDLHPHIERLQIWEMGLRFHHFDCSALSSLRSLDVDWLVCPQRPSAPFDIGSAAERIMDLSITLRTERKIPTPFTPLAGRMEFLRTDYDLNFLTAFTNLRQLVLQSRIQFTDPLQTLLRIIPPAIERFAYRPLDHPIALIDVQPVSHSLDDTISDIAHLLRRLPHLSHLGLIDLPAGVSTVNGRQRVESIIETLSNATPTLRFVGFHPDGSLETSQVWWDIVRTENGSFLSCAEVSEEEYRDDIGVDFWGDAPTGVRFVGVGR